MANDETIPHVGENFPTGPPPKTPIGVPKGYKPPEPTHTGGAGYYDADGTWHTYSMLNTLRRDTAYVPGEELKPANLNPKDIIPLQEHLVEAGLLKVTDVRLGRWDSSSASAYKVVLAYANAYGVTAADAIRDLINNPTIAKARAARASQITALTNPIDIRAAVSGGGPGKENTAQRLTGKDLPANEVKDFTSFYQQQEANARAQLQNADLSGKGGTYTQAPDLTNAAQDYIKQHNLADTVAYGTASRMLQFYQMLGQ